MAIQFHPLPKEVFGKEAEPYIERFNREMRDLAALEGIIKEPRQTKRSDDSISRRGEVQVHTSRITPSIVSATAGAPNLTLGLTNAAGTTTTAIAIDASIALFGTALPSDLSTAAATGTSAFAARADHVHEVKAIREFGGTLLGISNITDGQFLQRSGTQIISGAGGSGAPSDALYVVGATNGTLTNELLITGNTWITGDTTVAGQVKFNIVAGSIGTTQLESDSVTYAKIQNVTDARLLGRAAGSNGDTQELTTGGGLSLSGTSLSITSLTKDLTIESPVSGDSMTMFYTNVAVTVQEVRTVVRGSGGPTVAHIMRWSTDRSTTGNTLTVGESYTNITTGSAATLSASTVSAASYIWPQVTGISGTIKDVAVHVRYRIG